MSSKLLTVGTKYKVTNVYYRLAGRADATVKPLSALQNPSNSFLLEDHSMGEAQTETDVLLDAHHAGDPHRNLSDYHRFMREALNMVKWESGQQWRSADFHYSGRTSPC